MVAILKDEHTNTQVDDETLLVARDVRVLRQRRKQASDEAISEWSLVQTAMPDRQAKEKVATLLELRSQLSSMTPAEVEAQQIVLREQLLHWHEERDKMRSQLEQLTGNVDAAPPAVDARKDNNSKGNMGRKLSFGKKEKPAQAPPSPPPAEPVSVAAPPKPPQPPNPEPPKDSKIVRKGSFGKSGKTSSLTRVLSFGKSKKEKDKDGEETGEKKKTGSTAGNLVRKLSFGKKK